MNSDSLVQLLQSSVRVTLGATASLIEVLQDPAKREENLTKLRQEWSKLSEDWEVKGESTEQEARNFVNNLLHQRTSSAPNSSTGSTATATAPPTTSPDVQVELQELTAQIAAIRAELEKMRNPE
uniref:Thylakoid lumen protein n=1 Tax=Oscillatoriales cyanobacterium SpSt-402 TaxID=2282168 RepID=A0A832M680_9CYAN